MDKNVEKLKLIVSGEITEDSDLDVGMKCRILDYDEMIDLGYDEDTVDEIADYCGKTFVCTLDNVKQFKNYHKSGVEFGDKTIILYSDMIKPVVVKGVKIEKKYDYKYAFRCVDKDEKIIDEMISKANRDYIKILLGYFGGTTVVKDDVVDNYIRMWAEAKYEFYILFGHKFKCVKPVDMPISDKEINNLFGELKNKYQFHSVILDYFDVNDVKNNKCPKNEVLENNIEIYKPGMKMSKFLHQYFLDDKFDVEVSKVLQNKNIKGEFCVSIDPVDYLMSSINKNSWTTCMTPRHGSQSNGCVAYMIDDSGVVAYQCNGREYTYDMPMGQIVSNSKQFRAYVLINKDNGTFFIHRGYPDNEILSHYKLIKDFTQSIIQSHFGLENADWYVADNNKSNRSNSPEFNGLYKLVGTARVAVDPTKEYTNRIGQFAWKDPVKYACSMEDIPINKVTFGVPYLICPACGKHIPKYGNNGNLCCCR